MNAASNCWKRKTRHRKTGNNFKRKYEIKNDNFTHTYTHRDDNDENDSNDDDYDDDDDGCNSDDNDVQSTLKRFLMNHNTVMFIV